MSAAGRALHALLPGTFDPFTLGHQELVRRARQLFARVTVGVAEHPEKRWLFDARERVELVRESLADLGGVEVQLVRGLLVDACRELGVDLLVRGVRTGTDFDYESQMARTNRALSPRLDTVLLVPDPSTAHLSSTLVRQIASMGGELSAFVPPCVERALRRRFHSGGESHP